MQKAINKGLGFGLTSGIITTLGLIIGLSASTNDTRIVLIGIITIAVADALSDAFGVHMLEESSKASNKQIYLSSFYTFLFKFLFALSFAIPVIFFTLRIALFLNIVWGLFLITLFSYYLAKKRKVSIKNTILEHLSIMFLVIFLTYFLGKLLERYL